MASAGYSDPSCRKKTRVRRSTGRLHQPAWCSHWNAFKAFYWRSGGKVQLSWSVGDELIFCMWGMKSDPLFRDDDVTSEVDISMNQLRISEKIWEASDSLGCLLLRRLWTCRRWMPPAFQVEMLFPNDRYLRLFCHPGDEVGSEKSGMLNMPGFFFKELSSQPCRFLNGWMFETTISYCWWKKSCHLGCIKPCNTL